MESSTGGLHGQVDVGGIGLRNVGEYFASCWVNRLESLARDTVHKSVVDQDLCLANVNRGTGRGCKNGSHGSPLLGAIIRLLKGPWKPR